MKTLFNHDSGTLGLQVYEGTGDLELVVEGTAYTVNEQVFENMVLAFLKDRGLTLKTQALDAIRNTTPSPDTSNSTIDVLTVLLDVVNPSISKHGKDKELTIGWLGGILGQARKKMVNGDSFHVATGRVPGSGNRTDSFGPGEGESFVTPSDDLPF